MVKKNHLISNGVYIDEKVLESDFHHKPSIYVYDHDGIKIQFVFSDEHVHDNKVLPRLVDNVFSSLKRMFGEYVYSIKMENMKQELQLKVSLYNKFMSL